MPDPVPSPLRADFTELARRPEIVADSRRRRPLFFDGKFLTAADLNREQAYLLLRQADLAQSLGFGVISGLRVTQSATTAGGAANAAASIRLTAGSGITPAGEVVVVGSTKIVDLTDAPRIEQINAAFGLARLPQDPFRNLNGLFVVGLRAVEFTANPTPVYPPSVTGETSLHDGEIIEATAVTLVPYSAGVTLDEPLRTRARVAREIFLEQKPPRLPAAVLPLALLYLRNGQLEWADEFLVRREAGDDDRFGFAFAPRALAEAHFFQYQDLLEDVEARNPGRFAAGDFFEVLPPGGPLPRAVVNTTDFTQGFFPPEARLELAVVPEDELPALMEDSIDLPPVDLRLKPEDNDAFALLLLVPVPRRLYAETVASLTPRRLPVRPALLEPISRLKPLDYLRQWKPALAGSGGSSTTTDSGAAADAAWRDLVNRTPRLWYVRRRNLPDGAGLASVTVAGASTAPPAPGTTGTPPGGGGEVVLPELAVEDERMLATLRQEGLWGRYTLLKAISSPQIHAYIARLFGSDLILQNPLLRHALMAELEGNANLTSESPEENFEMIMGGEKVKVLTPEAVEAATKLVMNPRLADGLGAAFKRFARQLASLRVRTVLGLTRRLPRLATLGLQLGEDARFQALMDRVVKNASIGKRQVIRDAVDKFTGR
jgi:hypothetical protein